MGEDVCEVTYIHEEKVKKVKKHLNTCCLSEVAKIFKALADKTRLKIAYALCIEDELCVCDVANIVGATTATASHHLRLLRNLGIAQYRKEGKLVYYSLTDEDVKQLLSSALELKKEGVDV